MLVRRLAGLTVAILALAPMAPAVAEDPLRGAWHLDEVGNPETALDSSTFGNDGDNQDITGTGTAYVFNGTSSRVVVPDSPSLDPGSADFSFGVTIMMTTPPDLGETYDVLRKGLAATPGGAYKLEVKNTKGTAKARCLVKDATKVAAAIMAPTSLADGVPHTITCSKTSTGVTLRIDSLAPRTKAVTALGSVSNTKDLALGAKAGTSTNTGFDWYRGRIDDAWVRVG